MKNPNELRDPARSVRGAKITTIVLGVIVILIGLISLEEPVLTCSLFGTAILLFITAAILNGLTEITQAAALFVETKEEEWNTMNEKAKAEQIDDAEVQ